MTELVHEFRPTLLEVMGAAVDDYYAKRRRRNSSDERARALEQVYGNAGDVRVIPYKKPPGPHSHEELESDNTPRKGELIIATAGGHGSPRNRPGRRNALGKRGWTEGDVLKAVYGEAVNFNAALQGQALQRALVLKGKLRIAVKMLRLKEAA